MTRVHVLALDGVFDTGLAVVVDTLTTANALSAAAGARFSVRVIGVRRRVTTGNGWRADVADASGAFRERPDVVVVPALATKTPAEIDARLSRRDVADAAAVLRRHRDAGRQIAAACTGTFVLGAAGLLDGVTVTTTWWLAPHFRSRFPLAIVDDARMLAADRGVVTAGAALAHVDLALHLVRQKSPSLAARVGRYLLVEPRPSQALFAIHDHLAHSDAIVERFERWARGALAEPFSLDVAARKVGVSRRTLARRLERVLGKSPLGYVQDLRVERAVHRLRTSSDSIDEIAAEVGYGDGVTLRALLRKKTGRGVRDLRA